MAPRKRLKAGIAEDLQDLPLPESPPPPPPQTMGREAAFELMRAGHRMSRLSWLEGMTASIRGTWWVFPIGAPIPSLSDLQAEGDDWVLADD